MLKWLLRLIDKIFKLFLGDDIFISYSRADGAIYAAGLANELAKRGFACRLDQWGTESGSEMPKSLKKALRRSAALVLVGTREAAKSKHVADEVSELKRMRRMIVPIVFNRVLLSDDFTPKDGVLVRRGLLGEADQAEVEKKEALWAQMVQGLPMSCEKSSTLQTGEPTMVVLNRIEKTCTFWRKDQRLRITSYAVTVLLVLLMAASAWMGNEASAKRKLAAQKTAEAKAAEQTAKEQQTIAENKTLEAGAAAKRAEEAGKIAKAAERVASEKTRLAEEATKKAEEQTRIALKAEERAKAATARANREEKRAQTNLARNYYNQAQAEAGTDPGVALLWAQRAVAAAPSDEQRAAIFKLRSLHLTRSAPLRVVNAPGEIVSFSHAQDRVITISDHEELSVWDIKEGKRLPAPFLGNGHVSFATNTPATFSPDGKWIAALTWNNPADETKLVNDLRLHVWDVATGKEQLNIYDPLLHSIGQDADLRFTPDSASVMITIGPLDAKKLLICDIPSKPQLNTIPSDSLRTHSIAGQRTPVPLSRNPKRNWFIRFTREKSEVPAAEASVSAGESTPQLTPLEVKLEVKDIRSGAVLVTILAATNFDFVDFTDDAERVVTVMRNGESAERMLCIWDLNTKKPCDAVPFGDFQIVGMNTNGSLLLVSRSENSEVRIWDVKARAAQPLPPIELHGTWSTLNAYFSDDGRYVVTRALANLDQTGEVSIWEIGTGLRIAPPLKLDQPSKSSLSLSNMTLAQAEGEGISVRSLRQRGEKNPLPTDGLPVAQGHSFIKAFLKPDQRAILTLDKEKAKPFGEPMTLQFWDLTTGRPLWNPAGITTLLVRDVNFHPTKNLFVTVALETEAPVQTGIFGDEEVPPLRAAVRVREMSTGETISGFHPPRGKFDKAVFSRDGSRLTTVESSDVSPWKVRLWDATTGTEIPGGAGEFNTTNGGRFLDFTRHGEFMLLLNLRDGPYSDWRELAVRSTEGGAQRTARFYFVRHGDAALAATILKQALKLTVTSQTEVLAEFGPGITISVKAAPDGAKIVNHETGKQFIAPPRIQNSKGLDFDPISGLVLSGPSGRDGLMRIWEGSAGAPVSEGMWHEGYVRAFAFTAGGEQVLTVTENGRVRLWYVGQLAAGKPPWMNEMGEALSGMQVVNDIDIQRLTPEVHAEIKRSYEKLLREAAERGDLNAQFVLRNWKPEPKRN